MHAEWYFGFFPADFQGYDIAASAQGLEWAATGSIQSRPHFVLGRAVAEEADHRPSNMLYHALPHFATRRLYNEHGKGTLQTLNLVMVLIQMSCFSSVVWKICFKLRLGQITFCVCIRLRKSKLPA